MITTEPVFFSDIKFAACKAVLSASKVITCLLIILSTVFAFDDSDLTNVIVSRVLYS